MTYHPQPGDFGLSTIGGPLGKFVSFAQLVVGDPSRYQHAFLVLDDDTVVEAQPGGARITPLDRWLANEGRKPLAFSVADLTPVQRASLVAAGRRLVGTPYSFLDYLSLALLARGTRPKWVVRRVRNSGHLICSQLVDLVYRQAGLQLFADDRDSGDVTPGDLAYVDLPWLRIRHLEYNERS